MAHPELAGTTFGIQLAVNTICGDEDHNRVVWIDTGSLMVRSRFEHIYKGCRQGSSDNNPSSSPSQNGKQFSCFDKLTHLHVSSLPHLLTMFINPPAEFPPPKTSLIIIRRPRPLRPDQSSQNLRPTPSSRCHKHKHLRHPPRQAIAKGPPPKIHHHLRAGLWPVTHSIETRHCRRRTEPRCDERQRRPESDAGICTVDNSRMDERRPHETYAISRFSP